MIDSLQASLEGESKGRAEALRVKKKLEADIQELEVALDHASKVSCSLEKRTLCIKELEKLNMIWWFDNF